MCSSQCAEAKALALKGQDRRGSEVLLLHHGECHDEVLRSAWHVVRSIPFRARQDRRGERRDPILRDGSSPEGPRRAAARQAQHVEPGPRFGGRAHFGACTPMPGQITVPVLGAPMRDAERKRSDMLDHTEYRDSAQTSAHFTSRPSRLPVASRWGLLR